MVVHPWIHSPFVGTDEDQLVSTGEWMSAPLRELAQRVSGTDEVLLLWDPESQRVELSVRDVGERSGLSPRGRARQCAGRLLPPVRVCGSARKL